MRLRRKDLAAYSMWDRSEGMPTTANAAGTLGTGRPKQGIIPGGSGIRRELSLGTRGGRGPVSKIETKAWIKTVGQPAELLKRGLQMADKWHRAKRRGSNRELSGPRL